MKENLLDKLERENLKIANFSKRVVAYLIDNIILSLIVFIIFYDKLSLMDYLEIADFLGNFTTGFFLLHLIYHTLFTFMYGASLGKMACKIMILNEELLDKPNFFQSLGRSFFRELSGIAFMLGFVWALGNDLCKTWHDYAARTIVVDVA
ncbi:MAG: RDD family protein [Campylobacter sp.]|nr:RDD family protein [Campylobacter sp.]